MNAQILSLYVYPIKSLAPLDVSETKVLRDGLEFDRRWFLVSSNGKVYTQRDNPILALFEQNITNNGLTISFKGDFISFPLHTYSKQKIKATHFGDVIEGMEVNEQVSRWFSEKLKEPVRLLQKSAFRKIDPEFALQEDYGVSAADGYPVLIVNKKSLDALNQDLEEGIDIMHFRPNVVLELEEAFQEERISALKIGQVKFHLVKDCARCQVINIDPKTAEMNSDILKTLASLNKKGSKIIFGRNAIPSSEGMLSLKDSVNGS